MELTISTYFFVPYLIFLCLKKSSYIFYNLLFFSAFTSISIFNIGNGSTSITLFQCISLILFTKVLILILLKKINFNIPINKWLLFFVIICGLSIMFISYKTKYIVLSPDNIYTNVKFSIQCITQYGYLLLGYIVYIISIILYDNKIINISKSIRVLEYAFISVLLLGIVQVFLPIELYNEYFRNTVYINNQTFLGMTRISSTNIEASMLALFITPIICMLLSKFGEINKLKYLFVAIFGIIIAVISNSSSFYFGIITYLIISIVAFFVRRKKILTPKHIIIYYISIIIIAILVILFKDYLLQGITNLVEKLNSQGVSGSERTLALKTHLDVFKSNIFFGIGFGTTRSYDLFSSWLVQIGVIGMSFYIIYIIKNIFLLIKKSNVEKIGVVILIFITNIIMFSSVPEFNYLYIWIYYAMADYLIYQDKLNEIIMYKTKVRFKGVSYESINNE
ncbi:hypothetical protein DWV12_13020 [Clostridium botulinum]|uniref:O-antigen ligase family protein n=1 Tax=Clostridium botulinum TaxID=1491 RepID=UPI00217EFF55|nr:O-antigen ligase family protein [Clostridium botulinum]MCS6104934.1 hypothetical protein [Clostridium botulinum]MCS6108283.1 hypothetical protein [Clostridium botulinum]